MKHRLLPPALALAGVVATLFTMAGTASTAYGAESCDALRTQIESKIATAGVERFTVTVVDAAAQANGQVVGSCELGSKKIVYEKDAGPDRGTATMPSPPRDATMLTECKDGTVSRGGDCKK
jgi:hypothetical protein